MAFVNFPKREKGFLIGLGLKAQKAEGYTNLFFLSYSFIFIVLFFSLPALGTVQVDSLETDRRYPHPESRCAYHPL